MRSSLLSIDTTFRESSVTRRVKVSFNIGKANLCNLVDDPVQALLQALPRGSIWEGELFDPDDEHVG